jgi:catechol 2,3-dioxygenase-like lactoylglutathione lyase family enzyme
MLFDHVDMRVRNLALVRPLYDSLLAAMGYTKQNADEESIGYHRPDETGAEPFIWLIEEQGHKPAETRVAFAAPTRADVDRWAEIARNAGARAFEAPQLVPDYGPTYYAAFFEDPEGNKLEICCRKRDDY